MLKKTWLFLLIIYNVAAAQTVLIDSLKTLSKGNIDTNNINTICKLILKIAESKPTESLIYINQAITRSKALNFSSGLAKAYNIKGICFDVTNKYDSAIIYYNQAKAIAAKNKLYVVEASSLNNLGLVYWNIGNYDLAISNYFLALMKFEKLKDSMNVAKTTNNIGLIYTEISKFNIALSYFTKALKIYKELNDQSGVGSSFTNIAVVYSENENLSLSFKYIDSSLTIKRKINDEYGLGISLVIKSSNLIDAKKYTQADTALKEAELIFKKIGDDNRLLSVYSHFASSYSKQNNYSLANNYAYKVLSLATKIKSLRKQQKALYMLSKNYYRLADYKNAYDFEMKSRVLRDSIFSIESMNNINEIKEKYEVEKKENLIEEQKHELSQQKMLVISLILAVILLFTIFYFSYVQHKTKNTLKIEQLQQQSNLKILEAEQKERVRIARELHDSIGQKLTVLKMFLSNNSAVLQTQSTLLDETITEVRTLSHNMIPEILNLGLIPAIKNLVQNINSANRIVCELNLNENSLPISFDKEIELSIFRIVQEILNNMIKHSEAEKITVLLHKNETNTTIITKDNGIGFDVKSIYKSTGLGWQNIFVRTKLIGANLDIKSSNKGTQITLTI